MAEELQKCRCPIEKWSQLFTLIPFQSAGESAVFKSARPHTARHVNTNLMAVTVTLHYYKIQCSSNCRDLHYGPFMTWKQKQLFKLFQKFPYHQRLRFLAFPARIYIIYFSGRIYCSPFRCCLRRLPLKNGKHHIKFGTGVFLR